MFKPLEPGDQCVLRRNGKYSVHDLYTMDGKLYAKVGSAFVGFKHDGSTTDNAAIEKLVTDIPLWRDAFGRVLTNENAGTRPKPLMLGGTVGGVTNGGQLLIEKQ